MNSSADAQKRGIKFYYKTLSGEQKGNYKFEENGKSTVGQAADTDTLVASANAYLNALNKLIIKRTKTAPDQSISAQQ